MIAERQGLYAGVFVNSHWLCDGRASRGHGKCLLMACRRWRSHYAASSPGKSFWLTSLLSFSAARKVDPFDPPWIMLAVRLDSPKLEKTVVRKVFQLKRRGEQQRKLK